jgi:hypothetical protein
MPLDDHTLLLQLERATEELTDRVEGALRGEDDVNCYCTCHEADVDDLKADVEALRATLAALAERVAKLEEV